jgi:hypothetical protein
MVDCILDEPNVASETILLAHGAGAPMDSPWMNAMAAALVREQFRVIRFEFAYMAARRRGQEATSASLQDLTNDYTSALRAQTIYAPLLIGGKSMGGAIASLIADPLFSSSQITGVVCFGFPFHGRSNPTDYRAAHLQNTQAPTLIVQGTADPFGNREEVAGYKVSQSVHLCWISAADHDLASLDELSLSHGNIAQAAREAALWWRGLGREIGSPED